MNRYPRNTPYARVGANATTSVVSSLGTLSYVLGAVIVATIVALVLGSLGTAAFASRNDDTPVPEQFILDSMNILYGAFLAVDAGFNDPSRFSMSNPPPSYGLGLTPTEIAALGYFKNLTTVLAFGPFASNHTNQPGAFQAFGIEESSVLQVQFEGGLFADGNYLWFPDPNFAPRLYHTFPEVSAYLGHNRVTVNAQAVVTWGTSPGDNANFTMGGQRVALVGSLAQYELRKDANGNAIMPQMDWIQFTIRYEFPGMVTMPP